MINYFDKVKDKYGRISHMVTKNGFVTVIYDVNIGIVNLEPEPKFCDFMLKHNSLYTMECFYDEITNMLKNQFNEKPLILSDQLVTIIEMQIDMIVLKYIHRFDSVCMYSLEMNNEK